VTAYLKLVPVTDAGGEHISIVEHKPSEMVWRELAEEVGGQYIEYVPVRVGSMLLDVICDEEARCHEDIPPVSTVYETDVEGRPYMAGHTVGPILIAMRCRVDGQDASITPEAVEAIKDHLRMLPTDDGKEHMVLEINLGLEASA
jgi:hypothetical protein